MAHRILTSAFSSGNRLRSMAAKRDGSIYRRIDSGFRYLTCDGGNGNGHGNGNGNGANAINGSHRSYGKKPLKKPTSRTELWRSRFLWLWNGVSVSEEGDVKLPTELESQLWRFVVKRVGTAGAVAVGWMMAKLRLKKREVAEDDVKAKTYDYLVSLSESEAVFNFPTSGIKKKEECIVALDLECNLAIKAQSGNRKYHFKVSLPVHFAGGFARITKCEFGELWVTVKIKDDEMKGSKSEQNGEGEVKYE